MKRIYSVVFTVLVAGFYSCCGGYEGSVLAAPALSLTIKAEPLGQALRIMEKRAGTRLRSEKEIARQKISLFTREVSLSEALENLCLLRGHEIERGEDGSLTLRESGERRALVREKRSQARSLRLRNLKKRVAEVEAALNEGATAALSRRDPGLAQNVMNQQWQSRFGLFRQLAPEQRQAVLSGRTLSFNVPEMPSETQEMFLDAVGRMQQADASGRVEWATDILRDVGILQITPGGPPSRPTLYLRIYSGGGQYVPDWYSIDLLRPDPWNRDPLQPPPAESEQGKDDPALQKEITLERHVCRKRPDSDETVPYGARFEELLQQLARESGLNVIATNHRDNLPYGPEDVRRQPIYLRQNVQKQPVWKALNILAATCHYTWERQGDWIHFRKKDWYLFDD